MARPKGISHTDVWKTEQSIRMSGDKNPFYGHSHTEEQKLDWGRQKSGVNAPRYGLKNSLESRMKMAQLCSGDRGSNWIDGRTKKNKVIRDSLEYRLWEKAVFERDDYTCQITGIRGGKLSAHHIEDFGGNPKLRFVVANGITWNRGHHKVFHLIYGFGNNSIEQAKDFVLYV